MSTIFFISDTHFGHKKIVDGFSNSMHQNSGARPFSNIDEHDAALIENWNKTVGPNDTVYHVGDAFVGGDITDAQIEIWKALNGRKNFAPGNHCTWNKIQRLVPFCNKIQASFEFKGDVIVQHIPVHPMEVTAGTGRFKLNIHGHLHRDIVQKEVVTAWGDMESFSSVPDKRYFNVSCEQINYTPIAYDEIKRTVLNG